jgi:hypothetical protein
MRTSIATALILPLALAIAACGNDDDIDSDTEARHAYLGFDAAIDRAINLGFDGFNAASSANIPPQESVGDVAGTMTISGQVDQGASDNKEMRLLIDVVDYQDDSFDDPDTEDFVEAIDIIYNISTDTGPPALDLSLRNVPNGTFAGTLLGTFVLSGDIESAANFNLVLSGDIEDSGGSVIRSPGTLSITGTVTSGDGTYDVDVQR